VKRGTVLTALVAGALVLSAASVMAAPQFGVVIEVLTHLPAGSDAFAAHGPAVELEVFPASGSVSTGPYDWPPPKANRDVTMVKYFVCAGGTFDIELRVRYDESTGNTTGHWKVINGTGDYASLRGSGTLTGTLDSSGTAILDRYLGRVGSPGSGPVPDWWVMSSYLVWRGGW